MFRFRLEELRPYRNVTEEEVEWLSREGIQYEVDRLYKVLGGDKDKTLRALSRCLDFVSLYPDIDKAGDWSLVRQIVLNETLLDDLHQRLFELTEELEVEDMKAFSEISKAMNGMQIRINNMIKSLGTNRQERRKDSRDQAVVMVDVAGKLESLRRRTRGSRDLITDMEKKIASSKKLAVPSPSDGGGEE